jgi:hypothetical protein
VVPPSFFDPKSLLAKAEPADSTRLSTSVREVGRIQITLSNWDLAKILAMKRSHI